MCDFYQGLKQLWRAGKQNKLGLKLTSSEVTFDFHLKIVLVTELS